MTGAERLRMTYAAYLAAEEASETKHEFLREYVLVSQKEARVEVFTRDSAEAREWRFAEATAGGSVRLHSVDVTVSLEDVSRGVAFAAG